MADSGNPSFIVEKKKAVGATRHCCYGICNSDSRYADRDHMKDVFWIPFPKPKRKLEKCQRWLRACGRDQLTVDRVTRWTYICSKHFVGGHGPTEEHPDPIPATLTPNQVDKFARKRKAPTPRAKPVSKKLILEVSDALLSLQDAVQCYPANEQVSQLSTSIQDQLQVETIPLPLTTDQETQTSFTCRESLANKIQWTIHKNHETTNSEVIKAQRKKTESQRKFCYENLCKNCKLFKFYFGITVKQFEHLFLVLKQSASVDKLVYWQGSKTSKANKSKVWKRPTKLLPKNQLLLFLMKMRHCFPNKDLAYRYEISASTVSSIVNTWIQYLFNVTSEIRKKMFPSKSLIQKHLPASFKSFKNVRIIIDCFEILVQCSRNFAEQGNMYSSYKHHATLKCLVAISPSGAITFLSDVFEGSISDKEIFVKSGIVDLLEPGDLVIADRGFLIKDVLMPRRVELNIPPFLCGRSRLTPQEEILTKRIARVRIHVERAIERMKKFKIIGRTFPLNLKPVATEIVHIIGFLVNYQSPLVK